MTQKEWKEKNIDTFDWLKQTYPFLQKFDLPILHDLLIEFYYTDMENRNLEPSKNFANNYEFVFSYFLDNYDKNDSDKFKGKSTLENILNSIPEGVNKTLKPISKTFNVGLDTLKSINENLPLILGVAGLFLVARLLK